VSRTSVDIARTRALWTANKPGETGAPAYEPYPPVTWQVALALVAALLWQSSLGSFLQFRGATISFVPLVVAWYAVRTGSLRGLTFGLIAGACEDALAGSTGAAWTLATGLIGLTCGRLRGTSLADTRLVLVPGAALATFVRYCAFAVAMQAEGRPLALPLTHLHVALWQSALGAIVAFVVLRVFPRLGAANAHRR
jgi:uncharacterized membrane protein